MRDTFFMLEDAMSIIDDYLNAGSKDDRRKVAEKAKFLYKEHYGREYVNRNERRTPTNSCDSIFEQESKCDS